jgi:diaminopimelate decarboxylase
VIAHQTTRTIGELIIRLPEPTAFNPFVSRRSDGTLWFDGIDLSCVAEQFGTPIWVSSPAVAHHNLARLREATKQAFPHCRHAYALKANTTSSLVKALVRAGCDLDVSSETELALARHMGVPGDRLLLNGSCKSPALLKSAFAAGVRQLSIDSFDDVQLIGSLARELGIEIRCLLRMRAGTGPNDARDSRTRSILDRDDGKFGLDGASFEQTLDAIGNVKGIALCGVHVHLGFIAYAEHVRTGDELAVRRAVLREAVRALAAYRQRFIGRPVLNVGGGIRSAPSVVIKPQRGDDQPARLLEVAAVERHVGLIQDELWRGGLTPAEVEIQFETGGFLVDTSTLMLVEVLGESRRSDGTRVVILNASTRTFVTNARLTYPAIPLIDRGNHELATIVGNSCAPDTLVTGWPLPHLPVGSLIALLNQGAYCETESTQFNGLNRPGVVVADGARLHLVKRPERWDDHYLRDQGYALE